MVLVYLLKFVIIAIILLFGICRISKELEYNFKAKVLRGEELISGKYYFIFCIKLFIYFT